MSEPQEDSFISHLVELRDRLMRSLIAIAVPGYNNRPPREGRPLNEGMIKGDWQTWEAKL